MGQFTTLRKCILLFSLSCSFSIASSNHLVYAQEEPTELRETLTQMETAANQQDLTNLMQFYSPEFTNSDGLRYDSVATALKKLWENYPDFTYKITLDSWEKIGEQLVAETTTTMEGTRIVEGRPLTINSTIRSRQYFEEQKLIRQEILSEETKTTSGNPPAITVMVPETAKIREQFNFDVIVQEPLKNGILLGGAIEEQTGSDRYLKPSTFELDALASGGVFKSVTAPGLPGNYWLSAIIIQGDGTTTVTRRVIVEPN